MRWFATMLCLYQSTRGRECRLASRQAVRSESALTAAKCFTDILRNGYEQRPVCGDKLLFLEDVGCSRKIQEGTLFASRARRTLRGQGAGDQQSLAPAIFDIHLGVARVFHILAEQGEVIRESASGTKELPLRLRFAEYI